MPALIFLEPSLLRRLRPTLPRRWLPLLHALLLRFVFLLQLLSLLLVPLFQLLRFRWRRAALRVPLVFLLLLLLKLLPFPVLLGVHFFLLLLIFLILLGVARVWRRTTFHRRNIFGMHDIAGTIILGSPGRLRAPSSCATTCRWMVWRSGLAGLHYSTAAKVSGPWCSRDSRLALVHRGT